MINILKMPEDILCYLSEGGALLGEKLGEHRYFAKGRVGTQYRLKSTVDAERAADSKTIAALAVALEEIKEITKNVTDLRTFNLIRIDRFAKHALSDNAPRIEKAQDYSQSQG